MRCTRVDRMTLLQQLLFVTKFTFSANSLKPTTGLHLMAFHFCAIVCVNQNLRTRLLIVSAFLD